MLRFSLWALAAMLLFGLVFALLPTSPDVAASGVTLQDVKLRLYPAQDQQAEWRFEAKTISVDPQKGDTSLEQLGQGARWVKDKSGTLQEDLTIQASQLIIDKEDNLHANKATLYTLADCSTFTLSSSAEQQVVINQQGGYSAPRGEISSPIQSGEFLNVSSNFDFSNFRFDEQLPGAQFASVASQKCVDGKLQPKE
ncbi:hypothetical protein [Deinococcus sp.]|uniref:hypothetical protein n=1 Tax=Deinococcus sp. TaxID=47478 RepID=UPI003B5CBC33